MAELIKNIAIAIWPVIVFLAKAAFWIWGLGFFVCAVIEIRMHLNKRADA